MLETIAIDQMLDLVEHRIDIAFRIGGTADGPFIARRLASDHNVFVAELADYLAGLMQAQPSNQQLFQTETLLTGGLA